MVTVNFLHHNTKQKCFTFTIFKGLLFLSVSPITDDNAKMQSQSAMGALNSSPGSHKITPGLIYTVQSIEIRTLLGPNKNNQLQERQWEGEKAMETLNFLQCCWQQGKSSDMGDAVRSVVQKHSHFHSLSDKQHQKMYVVTGKMLLSSTSSVCDSNI